MTVNQSASASRRAAGLIGLVALSGLLVGLAAAQEPTKPAAPDAPKRNDITILRLRNTTATEMVQILQSILSDRHVRIVPEPISNTILVSAPDAELAGIKDLINTLDTPRPEDDGRRLSVFQLRNLEPDKALEEALR